MTIVNYLIEDKHVAPYASVMCPIGCAFNCTQERFDGELAEPSASSELSPMSFFLSVLGKSHGGVSRAARKLRALTHMFCQATLC